MSAGLDASVAPFDRPTVLTLRPFLPPSVVKELETVPEAHVSLGVLGLATDPDMKLIEGETTRIERAWGLG